MTASNLHALTGAYVLDALDAAELVAFEDHLRQCQECRAEVATLHATAARLASATATTPPAALRGAVMAQVARTPQVLPGTTPYRAGSGERATARRRAPRRWLVTAAAAAAVVIVGVGGGSAWYSDHQATELTQAMESQAMQIVSAPDAVSHPLELGSSHVVMSAQMSAAVLMGERVPMPAGDGSVYQVWMMHADGSAAPGPTFMPHDGEVMAIVEGDLSAVTELAVTIEPVGGSMEPTGSMVAHIEL